MIRFFSCLFILNLCLGMAPLSFAPPFIWDDNRIVDELGLRREGLHEYTFRRMMGDQLGWMDMNPYALIDLGYTDSLNADLSHTWQSMIPLMLSTHGNGEPVKVYFRQREGRAKPLPPHVLKTFQSNEATVTRLIQKGGLPTGTAGGHKDGLLDLSEAYGDMIWGEILHQNGALSTRGLLATRQQGVRRNMPGGPGLDAGLMIRFGELPRLREPEGWKDNYQNAMLGAVKYEHPLIISGLETLNPQQLNWFLALHNEALLKDMWVLHGSYTYDENRSAALIDFGTMSALWEPNPHASLGYTSYAQEIEESGNKPMERMGDSGRDVPAHLRNVNVRGLPLFNQVFWSSFAFAQLRRLGLTDEQILGHFTRETIPGSNFQFYLANDKTLDFARSIMEIDKQTMHSLETFSVDWNDGKSLRTDQRVVVNTRKLLQAILETQAYNWESPTEGQIRDLLRRSFFGTHAGGKGPDTILSLLDRDPGKRDYLMKKVRDLVQFSKNHLRNQLNSDDSGARQRASSYATEQHLPHRKEVQDLAWHWAHTPGSFGKEFVPKIEGWSPQEGPVAARRKLHLQSPHHPHTSPRDYFMKLPGTCLRWLGSLGGKANLNAVGSLGPQ